MAGAGEEREVAGDVQIDVNSGSRYACARVGIRLMQSRGSMPGMRSRLGLGKFRHDARLSCPATVDEPALVGLLLKQPEPAAMLILHAVVITDRERIARRRLLTIV